MNNIALRFLIKSLILYIMLLLLLAIPKVELFVEEVFRNSNNLWFNDRIENSKISFNKNTENSFFDTVIHLKYSKGNHWNYMEYHIDSRFISYIPKALFISLFLSTTGFNSISKKVFAGLAGMFLLLILTHFLLFVRIYTMNLQVQESLGLFRGSFKDRIYIFLLNYFASYTWIVFFLPVVSWIMVSSGVILNNLRSLKSSNKPSNPK